jgi:hypothetical protein
VSRFAASVGGLVATLFLGLLGAAALPSSDEGTTLLAGLASLFLAPVALAIIGYIAWRGGTAPRALGRGLVSGGAFGIAAVGLSLVRFTGDHRFELGVLEYAVPLLLVGAFLVRSPRFQAR